MRKVTVLTALVCLLLAAGCGAAAIELPESLEGLYDYNWVAVQDESEPDVYRFYSNGELKIFGYAREQICNWSVDGDEITIEKSKSGYRDGTFGAEMYTEGDETYLKLGNKLFKGTYLKKRTLVSLRTDFGFCLDYYAEEYSVSKSPLGGIRLTKGEDSGLVINRLTGYQQDLSVFTQDELMPLMEQNGEIIKFGEYEVSTVNDIERVSFSAVCEMEGVSSVIQYTYFNFNNETYFAAVLVDGDDFAVIEPYREIIDTIRK